MFNESKFLRNSFSITFERQPLIRRSANKFEDFLKNKLQGHYSQPLVVSIPDEMEPEFPRIIFTSNHGFSQIIISQINISLNVTYSPEWQNNIEKGRGYLSERVNILYDLLNLMDNVKPHFSGLTTNVRIPSTENDEKILLHFSKLFLKNNKIEQIAEFQFKFTTVISDKFFSILTVGNYRRWKMPINQKEILQLSFKKAEERGLEIFGDFNDRYSFNEDEHYSSKFENSDKIIVTGINQIQKIIEKIRG